MCLWPSHSATFDIAERYRIWVLSRLNGVWNSDDDYNNMKYDIKNHLMELDNFLGTHPEAKFSYI